MPIAEKDVTWVREPKMGLFEQLYLPALAAGLATTMGHAARTVFGGGAVTQQFPEQRPNLPAIYRGVHRLNRDEQNRVKCVACYMCATACPAHCINIEAQAAPADWEGRDKIPRVFEIDMLKCIYCGYCVEACPKEAIEMTNKVPQVHQTRQEFIYGLGKLLNN